MRRLVAIVLAVGFAALGSGAVEWLHNAHHAAEDRKAAETAKAAGQPAPDLPEHDETNCPFHVLLHLPALPVIVAPPTVTLQRAAEDIACAFAVCTQVRLPERIDCRGPPAV